MPNSGLRVLSSVNTTGRAVSPSSYAGDDPQHRSPRVRGRRRSAPASAAVRRRSTGTPARMKNDACQTIAMPRRIPLLGFFAGVDRVAATQRHPGPSAEDRGFEPLRAVNPTRVPGERHRPLGESSVGNGSRPVVRPESPSTSAGTSRVLALDSWTPRGVHPVNSPRAGRQQGSMGSGGCAGSPSFQPVSTAAVGERPPVSFQSLGRDELQAAARAAAAQLRRSAGQEAQPRPDPRQAVARAAGSVQCAAEPARSETPTATATAPTPATTAVCTGCPSCGRSSASCWASRCRT